MKEIYKKIEELQMLIFYWNNDEIKIEEITINEENSKILTSKTNFNI